MSTSIFVIILCCICQHLVNIHLLGILGVTNQVLSPIFCQITGLPLKLRHSDTDLFQEYYKKFISGVVIIITFIVLKKVLESTCFIKV